MEKTTSASDSQPTGEAHASPTPADMGLITWDQFEKVKMVTAEVISAAELPKADKLLVLQLKVGDKTRQIVAGIKQHYSATPVERGVTDPEGSYKPCVVGKTIIIVENLVARTMRGVESNGMLLAARLPDGGLRLVTMDGPTPSGLAIG